MRTSLSRLFGQSPFGLLRAHMEKVARCIRKIPSLFKELEKGNYSKLEKIAEEISSLEHEADIAKNDFRNTLRSNLFLPVDRRDLLHVLSLQDNIADKAEDIGALIVLRPLVMNPAFSEDFHAFLEKNLECFQSVYLVIAELDELFETSFGGSEAEKIKQMVDQVALLEYRADVIQHQLLKKMFNCEPAMDYRDFHLWLRIAAEVNTIANISETLANRVLMTMELR
jgi:uncharacterized protein